MSAQSAVPDHTAVRVALWRAMHVQVDSQPHVLVDEVGLRLAAPYANWRDRPDMHPEGTKIFRASIIARARLIEDLIADEARRGLEQYVILGAGLDSFAQRRPDIASKLQIFEVDQPATQAWKKQRLIELGYGIPNSLHFVPVDFEAGESWWDRLLSCGFDMKKPAVVVSTGVSMYLTREAVSAMLKMLTALAPGSTFAMSYLLPMEMASDEERVGREMAEKGARASGTPFISFFTPDEMTKLALDAGFKRAKAITAADMAERYFKQRNDGLRPTKSEEILLAQT